MTHDHNFFTPEQVDEQVDRLSLPSTRDHLLRNRGEREPSQVGEYLVEDLSAYYQVERQENIASLESAWKRISARQSGEREHIQSMPTQPLPITPVPGVAQERFRTMRSTVHNASRGRNFSRQLGLVAAILVSVLLVGSLVVIANLSHQQNATSAPALPAKIAPTPTSTPLVPGKLLYTTPPDQMGFNSLAWSPDSKRVASATVASGGVQFWDATTGAHRVTVQLPGGNSEWAYSLSWSPNSDNVAVGTNQRLLIVNGQSGKIISNYADSVQITSNTTPSGQVFNSSLSPNSGGYGYRATTWSPDGHQIASAISVGASGEVLVANSQTGATNFTLSLGSSDDFGELAWSSDGQYIAASTWNTQATDPTHPINRIVVWNVSTRQMVFQHNNFLGSSDQPIAWQPGSHNLAFVGTINNKSAATLEIWDTTTSKLVKQYPGQGGGTGALTWSPDGKSLAYPGHGGKSAVNVVIIIDAATGKQIYVYKGHHLNISTLAWSPNGLYIVSAEGNTEGPAVAQVWTA
jgi:WD40 repeat protein